LGVVFAPLVTPDPQPTLFPLSPRGRGGRGEGDKDILFLTRQVGEEDGDRTRRLAECKDSIRRRFGFTALLSGSALQLAEGLDRDRENFRLRTPCLTR